MHFLTKPFLLASAISISALAGAKNIDVKFELPNLEVERYINPYVAIWAEQNKQSKPLLVWHLVKRDEDRWLPDIKRWWRKIGRYDHQADGITGATQGPGLYTQSLDIHDWTEFTLYVEVAREKGGRSLVKTDINIKDGIKTYTIAPDSEIGKVTINVK